jgi:hypothetical protein
MAIAIAQSSMGTRCARAPEPPTPPSWRRYEDNRIAASGVNAQIKSLARVLNARFVTSRHPANRPDRRRLELCTSQAESYASFRSLNRQTLDMRGVPG